MKAIFRKIISISLISATIVSFFGCNSKEAKYELNTAQHGGQYWVSNIDSDNEDYYNSIVDIGRRSQSIWPDIVPEEYKISGMSQALQIMLYLYRDEPDKKYHVVVSKCPEEFITEEEIEQINISKNVNIKLDELVAVGCNLHSNCKYYCMLTATEILAIRRSTFKNSEGMEDGYYCQYIGSGEGSIEDANWDTEEGWEVYCELFGDDFVQYTEGMSFPKKYNIFNIYGQ